MIDKTHPPPGWHVDTEDYGDDAAPEFWVERDSSTACYESADLAIVAAHHIYAEESRPAVIAFAEWLIENDVFIIDIALLPEQKALILAAARGERWLP